MFLVHLFIHLLIKCMDSISFLFLGIWLDATWKLRQKFHIYSSIYSSSPWTDFISLDATWKLRQKFYIYSSIHSSSPWTDFIWFLVAFWLNASWNQHKSFVLHLLQAQHPFWNFGWQVVNNTKQTNLSTLSLLLFFFSNFFKN